MAADERILNVPPPMATAAARLNHAALDARGVVQDPPAEVYEPEIHPAATNPTKVRVLTPPGLSQVPLIYLMRAGKDVTKAYALTSKKEISLDHHGPEWGCIQFAIVYHRVKQKNGNKELVFQAPTEEEAEYVAIKRLKKSVVRSYLDSGGEEHPNKEIARMQELGDNVHVLQCLEALEDDEFLYIVMPKACEEGTLQDAIHWCHGDEVMEPGRARAIFRKILRILLYLLKHNICHRDISPDNFLFLTPDNLVVFDLAMSIRLPVVNNADGDEEHSQRTLCTPVGNFGTYAWMAPEIFSNRIFDGVTTDLWSASVILYNLLTNQVLYRRPHYVDISYKLYVLARGLSSNNHNERTVEVLSEVCQNGALHSEYNELVNRAIAHLNLSREAVQLLENLLEHDPFRRWSLAQAIESDFVRGEG
jgi:serine/threonine protein kinase